MFTSARMGSFHRLLLEYAGQIIRQRSFIGASGFHRYRFDKNVVWADSEPNCF